MRRYRSQPWLRSLMQDITLHPHDLIAPLFIHDKSDDHIIEAMPFTKRYGLKGLKKHCQELINAGIKAIALFPVIDAKEKTLDCKAAYDPNGLVPNTIKALKDSFPYLVIIADIALDPFNPSGQDGILNQGIVDNDLTVSILEQQAVCYARAGADIVAPSDMMDGRIAAIRNALDREGLIHTLILSYSIKFASSLYGPFRHAVDSSRFLGAADKKTYQMDYQSLFQTTLEGLSDREEGADLLMVKPGLHYLDVITRLSTQNPLPVWSYHVSGECVMLDLASKSGMAPFESLLLEALIAQRRAGAQKILTYFALEGAKLLHKT